MIVTDNGNMTKLPLLSNGYAQIYINDDEEEINDNYDDLVPYINRKRNKKEDKWKRMNKYDKDYEDIEKKRKSIEKGIQFDQVENKVIYPSENCRS